MSQNKTNVAAVDAKRHQVTFELPEGSTKKVSSPALKREPK
jgi:hypothetical protein